MCNFMFKILKRTQIRTITTKKKTLVHSHYNIISKVMHPVCTRLLLRHQHISALDFIVVHKYKVRYQHHHYKQLQIFSVMREWIHSCVWLDPTTEERGVQHNFVLLCHCAALRD